MMNRYLKVGLIVAAIGILFLQATSNIIAKNSNSVLKTSAKIVLAPTPIPMPPPPAPSNDDCSGAFSLSVNAMCSFTSGTVDQSTESLSPSSCNGFSSTTAYDVWYKFIASPSGQNITVKGSASFDAVVVLMDSCSGSVIDCSDNTTSGGTEVIQTAGLTSGNTYYVRVYSYGSAMPATTDFDICVALPAPPPVNDDCINATLLTMDTLCNYTSGTVEASTQSGAADSCSSFSSSSAYDVWYKFVATSNHGIIKVHGAQSFDAVVILKDSCGGNTINCSDATFSGGVETIDDTTLVIGNTYYVRVYSYGSAIPSTPDFDICVSLPAPPPSNDDCSNATLLAIDSTCNFMQATVDGATQSESPSSCGSFTSTAAFDVWYKFVADSNAVQIKVKGSTSFDAVLVLKDSCGGNTIDCSDGSGSGGTETITASGLTAGNTYYVRVYDYGSTMPETPEFEICISLPPPPPANDNCANAIMLTVDSTCNYTMGTVLGATQSMAADSCNGFSSTSAYDVWYKFVATAANNTISVQGSQSFDPVVILKDSCSGSTLDCADATFSNGLEVVSPTNLTVGNTYYVRVYSYGSAMPQTQDFNICISIPPPPPANDDCANAIVLTSDSTCNFVSGTVLASTQSAPADSCNSFTSSAAFDVWYKFVANSTNEIVKVKGADSFDAVVLLKDGCTGSTVDCADNTTTGGTEMIEAGGLTIGNTYYVRVYSYGGSIPSTPGFDICAQASSSTFVGSIDAENNIVSIYPNPTNNKITINLVAGRHSAAAPTYKIINVNGQLVTEGYFNAGNQKEEVDLGSFTPGIYNVQITVDNTVVNKKVVVMNK